MQPIYRSLLLIIRLRAFRLLCKKVLTCRLLQSVAPLSDRHCTCDSSLLCKDCNMWHDAAEEENLHWIALFYETRAAYEFGGACGPFVVHLI